MPPRLKLPHEKLAPRNRHRAGPPASTTIGVLAVIVGIAAAIALRPAQPPASLPQAQPAARQELPPLLDGLAVGDRIGAWEVHGVRTVERKLGVDLLQNDQLMTVWIAKKGVEQKLPPRETERYALFIGYPPESQAAASQDFELMLAEFEQRLRRTEATSAEPEGL
jgi:hypothetical protein